MAKASLGVAISNEAAKYDLPANKANFLCRKRQVIQTPKNPCLCTIKVSLWFKRFVTGLGRDEKIEAVRNGVRWRRISEKRGTMP
jgi:hypothetical protein